MFLTRVPICILVLTCAALPGCGKNIPPDVASLIEKTEQLNDKCRGGSGDDPATMKACDARDALIEQIEAMNYCFGTEQQIQAEKRWQECAPASTVATSGQQQNLYSRALIGTFRCDPGSGRLDIAYFSDGTYLWQYKSFQTTDAHVAYGTFRVEGDRLFETTKAVRFLSLGPAFNSLGPELLRPLLQWSMASKGKRAFESSYVTKESTIKSANATELVTKEIRTVNWDGIDVMDSSRGSERRCIRASIPEAMLEAHRAEVPTYLR